MHGMGRPFGDWNNHSGPRWERVQNVSAVTPPRALQRHLAGAAEGPGKMPLSSGGTIRGRAQGDNRFPYTHSCTPSTSGMTEA